MYFFPSSVHGLDAWFGYLRTRESLLSKHYSDEGLLLSACRSGSTVRGLVDLLITCIRPLAELPFKLDLLYECKQLHQSLLQISVSVMKFSHNNYSVSIALELHTAFRHFL